MPAGAKTSGEMGSTTSFAWAIHSLHDREEPSSVTTVILAGTDRRQQPPHQSSFCPFKDIPRWREHQIYANDPEPTRREQPLEKAEREHVMWRDVEDGSIPRTQSEELSNPAGKSAPRDVSRLNGRAVHRSPFKPLRVGYDPHPRHPLPRTTATVGRALRDRIA